MPRQPPKVANASVAESRLSNTFAITEGQEADLDAVILPRDLIDPDPDQPRIFFDEEALRELGHDLRQHHLKPLQAIIVRPHPRREGRFMIVAGERRWRAAGQEYGDVERLRCTLRSLTEQQIALIQGAENDKRKDTSVIAKGRNYNRIKNGGNLTWNEVGQRVGKTENTVLRHVRLLRLPRAVQNFMEKNQLSEKHGRAFLNLQPSGNGVSGPDLSGEAPNKNHKRLMNNIRDTIERGRPMPGDEAIQLAGEYVCKTPEPHDDERHSLYAALHKKNVEEEAAKLRDKNRAALKSGDVSAQSAPLRVVKDGEPLPPAPQPVAAPVATPAPLPLGDLLGADDQLAQTLELLREWVNSLPTGAGERVGKEYTLAVGHIKEARRALEKLREK